MTKGGKFKKRKSTTLSRSYIIFALVRPIRISVVGYLEFRIFHSFSLFSDDSLKSSRELSEEPLVKTDSAAVNSDELAKALLDNEKIPQSQEETILSTTESQ